MHSEEYILENDTWHLKVSAKGAWLQTLAARSDRSSRYQDLLKPGSNAFCVDSESWQHAGMPLLFPFAGRSYTEGQAGRILIDKQSYAMPIHGFTHHQVWQADKGSSQLILRLKSEPIQTDFPFDYELQYSFLLIERRLRLEIEIQNRSAEPMPLALGWHPYFRPQNLPIAEIRSFIAQQQPFQVDSRGLLDPQRPIAIPFDPQESSWQSAIVKCRTQIQLALNRNIVMQCDPSLRTLTIWCPQPDDFICLEPWMLPPNAFMDGNAKKIAAQQTLSSHIDFICY